MNKKLFAIFLIVAISILSSSCSLFKSSSDDESLSDNVTVADPNADQFVDENGNPIEEIDPETGVNLLPEGNGIFFEEESDGVEIHPKKALSSQFVGRWEATSDQALFLYGNLEIVVAANNTWSADITGEKYVGKWTEFKDGLRLTGDLSGFDLVFDQKGKLIFVEHIDDSGQEYHTVLTKKD